MSATPAIAIYVRSSARIAKFEPGSVEFVILDLEDSLDAADRPAARAELAALPLPSADDLPTLLVRVNADADELPLDLEAIASQPAVRGVVAPKIGEAAGGEALRQIMAFSRSRPGFEIWVMGESAAFAARLPDLLREFDLSGILVGYKDLAADLGCELDFASPLLRQAAADIRQAGAAQGLKVFDGPIWADGDDVARHVRAAIQSGYDGVCVLSRSQLAIARATVSHLNEGGEL